MNTRKLTTSGVAALLGVTVGTLNTYRSREPGPHSPQGKFPDPDGYLGRTPWWSPSTVRAWDRLRPGGGGGRKRKQ